MDAGLDWRKSTQSGNAGCVEVAHLPDGRVALRDSKDRSLPPLFYTREEWEAFIDGAKAGELDLPGVRDAAP